jgi:Flp pilus assembly protein TadD
MHHLLNLLVHAANVALVYRISRDVFGAGSLRVLPGTSMLAAFSASLLFAVHPLQVEPVAWISGRKDVLMTFFLLVSFQLYLRWRGGDGQRAGWLVTSTIAFILALLSKSTAAAFPLVMVVCDRLVLGRRESLPSLLREKAVMVLAAAVAIVVAVFAGSGHDTSDLLAGFPPAVRVVLPIFTPVYYLWQLLWPSGLTPFTPPVPLAWVFLGAGVTVAVTAGLIRRRESGLLTAWLAFLLLLVPTIGGTFMETGMQPWADRFTYAPLIPVFIAVGAGVCQIPWPSARGAFLIALTLGLAAMSRAQLEHWRNTEAVWTRVVHSSPTLAKGHKNLGSIRLAQGRAEEAVQLFRQAIALKPAYSEAHNDLGLALAAAGRPGEALEAHRMAIGLDSTRVEGYNGYGIALLQMGDARGAYDAFRRGIEVHPEAARLRYNAGIATLALGDTAGAIGRFQETVTLDTTAVRAAEKAALLLDARGDAAAATWYARAASAGSSDAKAWLERRAMAREQGVR